MRTLERLSRWDCIPRALNPIGEMIKDAIQTVRAEVERILWRGDEKEGVTGLLQVYVADNPTAQQSFSYVTDVPWASPSTTAQDLVFDIERIRNKPLSISPNRDFNVDTVVLPAQLNDLKFKFFKHGDRSVVEAISSQGIDIMFSNQLDAARSGIPNGCALFLNRSARTLVIPVAYENELSRTEPKTDRVIHEVRSKVGSVMLLKPKASILATGVLRNA